MARPRVFISSTFIDFRQVRADIDSFLRSIGYDTVLFETGAVPYGHEAPLEASAYAEVERCDILVAIIGSRLGTTSGLNDHTITQNEIKKAVEQNKPIFVFVDRDTLAEYKTWERNKEVPGIRYVHADDPKIFEFIAQIYGLTRNNPVFPFQSALEIASILKDQFAGLFQDLLARRTAAAAGDLLSGLKDLAANLEGMVRSIALTASDRGPVERQLLLMNHPVFSRLKAVTNTPYRLYFVNHREMDSWLEARGWKPSREHSSKGHLAWTKKVQDRVSLLHITASIFDGDGNLNPMTEEDWRADYLTSELLTDPRRQTPVDIDDDIPF